MQCWDLLRMDFALRSGFRQGGSASPLHLVRRFRFDGPGWTIYDLLHDSAQFLGLVWLCNDTSESKILIATHGSIGCISAGNDRIHVRINFHQFLERFFAAHTTRQGQIKDDQIKPLARLESFSINIDALLGASSLRDFIAKMAERKFNQGSNRFFVVYDQNSSASTKGIRYLFR